MAKKRETPESLIVGFFTTADLSAATTLHNVVNGLMKNRVNAGPAVVKTVKATRNKGTTLTAASAAKPAALDLGGAEVEAA